MNNFNSVSDLINRIKISLSLNLLFIIVNFSKLIYNIINLLWKNSFIKDFFIFTENKKKYILIKFLYLEYKNFNSIQFIKCISKSNLRVYKKYKNFPKLMNGLGVYFISTSWGLFTDYLAKVIGIGGEIICYVF